MVEEAGPVKGARPIVDADLIENKELAACVREQLCGVEQISMAGKASLVDGGMYSKRCGLYNNNGGWVRVVESSVGE